MESANYGIIRGTKYRNVPAQLVPAEDVAPTDWRSAMQDNDNPTNNAIPYGFCHCGCGEKTPISKKTDSRFGAVKGEPRKFIYSHHLRRNRKPYWSDEDGCFLVPLTQGAVAKVDEQDVGIVSRHSWSLSHGGYAHAGSQGKSLVMHRVLLNPPNNLQVDHINGDRLDNRRSNLRLATSVDNARNRRDWGNGRSGFIGVKPYRRGGFESVIRDGEKDVYLGLFSDATEAAIFRDVAALVLHGEFAALNFPELREVFAAGKGAEA